MESHIEITSEPLNEEKLMGFLKDEENGAVVVFKGVVRRHSKGRTVRHIRYEAYDEMCHRFLKALIDEQAGSISQMRVVVYHRKGVVEPGETSLFIGVSTPYREEAFRVCREILEKIKDGLPIWKEEVF